MIAVELAPMRCSEERIDMKSVTGKVMLVWFPEGTIIVGSIFEADSVTDLVLDA